MIDDTANRIQSAKGTDIQHTPCRVASTRARRAPSGWCAWKAPVAAWTSTGLSASLCSEACTTQEVVMVEPLTFSVLFSLVCCSALAPWCSEACTTQLVVIVEPLMFSVLFSSRSPQLVVIVEPLMASVLFSCMLSLVRLATARGTQRQATRHLLGLVCLQALRLTCGLLEPQMLAAVLAMQLEAAARLVRLRAALALHAILVAALARHPRVCSRRVVCR